MNQSLEKIYERLPTTLQTVACSLEGWRVNSQRYGGPYSDVERLVQSRQAFPAAELAQFRDERLAAFVRHAAQTVPYYRRLFDELRIGPDEIRTLDDLRALPVLTKDVVRARWDEFVSTAVPRGQHVHAHTSGTTGAGFRFVTTVVAVQEQWAVWWRYRRRHGLDRGTWCAYFGGRSVVPIRQERPPYSRTNFPGRQVMFSGYHLSERTIGDYVADLNRHRCPWIHGYPSMISLLATLMKASGLSLDYPLEWVTTGAENLLASQRATIRHALGVEPIQHYGQAEGVANISQAPDGALVVDEDFAAVEFVPDASAAGCRIVGTNLSNLAMPLLRYDTGDIATLPATAIGRHAGRQVEAVDGRLEDFVTLPSGARVGRLDHIFKDAVHVKEAQVFQHADGSIELRVVKADGYAEADERHLLLEAHKRLGDAPMNIHYCREIQRTGSGKLRFVVSELSAVPSGAEIGVSAARPPAGSP